MESNGSRHVYYTVRSAPNEEIQISLRHYKEKNYIDCRVWFRNQEHEPFRPTKRGLFLSLALFEEFRKGIQLVPQSVESTVPESPRNNIPARK